MWVLVIFVLLIVTFSINVILFNVKLFHVMLRCACVCKVGLYPKHGADFGQIRIFYTMWMLFIDIITDIGL